MSTASYNQASHKRLLKDLSNYIKNENSYPYIKTRPLDDNIYEWHGNITPVNTYYDGFIIHFIMKFSNNYPSEPPKIDLCTGILHSNMIPNFKDHKFYLCLDLINNFYWMYDKRDMSRPYSGWSASYTVEHIINQLYSFLFDETVENYNGQIKQTIYQIPIELGGGERNYDDIIKQIEKYEKDCHEFKCSICNHTYDNPYPFVKQSDKSCRKTDIKQMAIITSNLEDKQIISCRSDYLVVLNNNHFLINFNSILHKHYNETYSFKKMIFLLEEMNLNWKQKFDLYIENISEHYDIINNIDCESINPHFLTYLENKITHRLSKEYYYKFVKQCVSYIFKSDFMSNIYETDIDLNNFISQNKQLYDDIIELYTNNIIDYNNTRSDKFTVFDKWTELLNTIGNNNILNKYSNILKNKIMEISVSYRPVYLTGCDCKTCMNILENKEPDNYLLSNISNMCPHIYIYYMWQSIFYNHHIISNEPHFAKDINPDTLKVDDKSFVKFIIMSVFNKHVKYHTDESQCDIYEYLDHYINIQSPKTNDHQPALVKATKIEKNKNKFTSNYFELLPDEIIINIFDRLSSIDRRKLNIFSGRVSLIISSPYYNERSWLECFYSKCNFNESRLGYPIKINFAQHGLRLKLCETTFDIISYESYHDLDVKKTVWNDEFTYWLPLYINSSHWRKSSKILANQINNYMNYNTEKIKFNNKIGSEISNINPYYVIEIYSTLMTNIIVDIMKGETHLSLKVLEGFCQIYRTFYELSIEYSIIKQIVDDKIYNFIKKPQHRHKMYTPNLGAILMMLTISDKYSWSDIKKCYLEESGDRNIMWMLIKIPFINKVTDPKKLLEISYIVDDTTLTREDAMKSILQKLFDTTLVGRKLLLFNLYFVNTIIGKDKSTFITMLDHNYGYPTNDIKEQFQKDINIINNIKSYDDFYKYLNIYKPADEILAQKILSSRDRSTRKGYNKTVLNQIAKINKIKNEQNELAWARKNE